MKHPQVLLLPVLMFTDYFLTVWGAIQKERKHNEHFKNEHYELNPVWQKQIAQKKWFNPRHILITLIVTAILAAVLQFDELPDFFADGLFGYLFVFFGAIIGRHLSNILIFREMARRRGDISGQIKMTHALALSISTVQYSAVAVPVLIIAAFEPTPFTIGALCGVGMLFVVHMIWIRKHEKKLKRMPPPLPPPGKPEAIKS